MSDGFVFNSDARRRISEAIKWVEQHKSPAAQPAQASAAFSRHPLRMAITTEEIEPGAYGGFKFTTGAKGSEAVTGEEYQGFYRSSVATDPPNLPSGTLCFAIWVPCDTLEDDETGWELTPVQCLEAA